MWWPHLSAKAGVMNSNQLLEIANAHQRDLLDHAAHRHLVRQAQLANPHTPWWRTLFARSARPASSDTMTAWRTVRARGA